MSRRGSAGPVPTNPVPTNPVPTNPEPTRGDRNGGTGAGEPDGGSPQSLGCPTEAARWTHGRTDHTVNRASLGVTQGPVIVWAARCPLGHPSQAAATHCRVCGRSMPPNAPREEIERPVLGRLVLPTGGTVELGGPLILGRDPKLPTEASHPAPELVILNDPRREVSSQHAAITLNYWDVTLTDLGSTNGTELVTPDGRRQRLVAHTPIVIVPGTRVILAEVFEMTFEAMP